MRAEMVLAGTVCLTMSACQGVQGHTYADEQVRMVFKIDGTASISNGTQTWQCIYVQDARTVTVTCEGEKKSDSLKINEDGSLQLDVIFMSKRLLRVD